MARMWCTKDDVVQDLARVTGCEVAIDDQCLFYGERPPPSSKTDDIDDEMKIMFGASALQSSLIDNSVKPDIQGIQSMLRMIDAASHDESAVSAQANDVIVISKLNPHVKEFVPRQIRAPSTNSTVSQETSDKSTSGNMSGSETYNSKTGSKTSSNITFSSAKRTETPKSEVEATIASLKQQACAKNDAISRNVALATLLRLITDDKPRKPKLYTPAFFENCKASDFKGTYSSESEISIEKDVKDAVLKEDDGKVQMKENTRETSLIEDTKKPVLAEDVAGILDDSEEHTNLTQEFDEDLSIDKIDEDERRSSVQKVNAWLNKTKEPKKKLQPVLLGQIGYKRKDTSASSSPITVEKKIPKVPKKAQEFVPSAEAQALYKRYQEKVQATEQKNLTIWEKAELDMKRKEESSS